GQTGPLLKALMTKVTVAADDRTVTYDGGPQGLNSYTQSLPDAHLDGEPEYELGGPDVGTYQLGVGGLYSHQQGYDIRYEPGTLTITPAELRVGVADARRKYGQANPEFAVAYDGFKGSDGPDILEGEPVFDTAA